MDKLSGHREGEDQKMRGQSSDSQLLIADMIHMWWSGKKDGDREKVLIKNGL